MEFVPGTRKAAILIAALGSPAAKAIYPELSEAELAVLSGELSALPPVDESRQAEILHEFAQQCEGLAGRRLARELLETSVGPEKTEAVLRRLRGREPDPALARVDPEALARIIGAENPQLSALLLSELPPPQAAAALNRVTEAQSSVCLSRVARSSSVNPGVIDTIIEFVRSSAEQGPGPKLELGGARRAAEIINELRPEIANAILLSIEEDDAPLAASIRDFMFTFEDFATVPAAAIRQMSAAVEKSKLSLALKGSNEQVRAQFLRNMSERAAELLQEDIEALGPVRKSDVQRAQKDIVSLARQLDASGKISLRAEAEEKFV